MAVLYGFVHAWECDYLRAAFKMQVVKVPAVLIESRLIMCCCRQYVNIFHLNETQDENAQSTCKKC